MEARDTVMSDEQIAKILFDNPVEELKSNKSHYQCIAEAQAEISFKMGYNQALKDIKDGLMPSNKEIERLIKQTRDEGKKAGIREVVKWVEEHKKGWYEENEQILVIRADFSREEWQVKLKDWGIE